MVTRWCSTRSCASHAGCAPGQRMLRTRSTSSVGRAILPQPSRLSWGSWRSSPRHPQDRYTRSPDIAARAAAHHMQGMRLGSGCGLAASATLLLFRSVGQHRGVLLPGLRPSGHGTGTGMDKGGGSPALLHRRASCGQTKAAFRHAVGSTHQFMGDLPIMVHPPKVGWSTRSQRSRMSKITMQ